VVNQNLSRVFAYSVRQHYSRICTCPSSTLFQDLHMSKSSTLYHYKR